METGQWYCCLDEELRELRAECRRAVFEHNQMHPDLRGTMGDKLRAMMGDSAPDARIEAPFHCAYGIHIWLGKGVFLNAGCTIIDTAPVRIDDGAMLGPNVQIYCAHHHTDPDQRRSGLEVAKPVTIGKNVWIGGGAIILPGVSIGDDAIVGAGAVVTKNVAPGVTVVGNPARPK
jgi:maltose O-acetyltransferase